MLKFEKKNLYHAKLILCTSTALTFSGACAAYAQEQNEEKADPTKPITVEEIVVSGVRAEIQSSNQFKRSQNVISDAIIGGEIGDLPDLSIAETLERITGVTADRFKGGASEISIRGLGAFLGLATLNGRELSSGSDGRNVNFGQFPSELFNGVVVFKSQQASLVEGGISGVVSLKTLRPLDYGKSRFQVLGLAGYSDYQDRVVDASPFNSRLTASYIDQFTTPIGDIGIAIGGQFRRDAAPEDTFIASSTFRPCNTNFSLNGGSNCSFDETLDQPTYFTSNQYSFRALETDADRDAVVLNVQWQPSKSLDINLDLQYSDRFDLEQRHNLIIADGRRQITPLEIANDGGLLAFSGNTRLENNTVWRTREEEYLGGGLNIAWQEERWSVAGDFGFSITDRRQDELDSRIRTEERVDFIYDSRGLTIPTLEFTDVSAVEDFTSRTFNLDDPALYTDAARARRRLENVDDDIVNGRLDFTYEIIGNFFQSISFGARYSNRRRIRDDGLDTTLNVGDITGDSPLRPAIEATVNETFPVRDIFAGSNSSSRGLTFATFDPQEFFVALTGDRNFGFQSNDLSVQDTDVEETTYAFYAQTDFASQIGSIPVTGNFGLRGVFTESVSAGFLPGIAGGESSVNVESNDFFTLLPSLNVILELAPDQFLRLAAYRALARPGLEDLSAGLNFDDDLDPEDLAENAADLVQASGNPFIEPLLSWNLDASYEWYISPDTNLALAGYFKQLETGLEVQFNEFVLPLNGVDTAVTLGRQINSDNQSSLYGLELSFQHIFAGLPAPFNGFGFRGGINFADSNFEFPDPTVVDGNALSDFVPALNIPGFSRWSGNLQLFWEDDKTQVRLGYRARTGFNQPFRQSSLRFTQSLEVVDFQVSYDILQNLELRFQVLDLFDEARVASRPVLSSLGQTEFSGRRVFLGLRFFL